MKLNIREENESDKEPKIEWNEDHDDLDNNEIYMDRSGYIFGIGERDDELPEDITKPIFGILGNESPLCLADDRSFKVPCIQLPREAISLTIDLSKLPPEVAKWIRENSK